MPRKPSIEFGPVRLQQGLRGLREPDAPGARRRRQRDDEVADLGQPGRDRLKRNAGGQIGDVIAGDRLDPFIRRQVVVGCDGDACEDVVGGK